MADELGMEGTPKCEFVDVFLNGEYLGNYLLAEKVEVGSSRVDITDLEDVPPEEADHDVTGGYLLEYDRLAQGEPSWFHANHTNLDVTIKSPEEATAKQKEYISNYVNEMEEAIYSSNGINSKGKHYTDYMDLASFSELYWINEIFKNGDYGMGSTYMYKDKDPSDGTSLMYGGPVWDFDIAIANACVNAGSPGIEQQNDLRVPEGWWLRNPNGGRGFQYALFKHEDYRKLSKQIYDEEVGPYLERLPDLSQQYADEIKESADMNFIRWDILNTPHQWDTPNTATTFQGEIDFIKNYLQKRYEWIDKTMKLDRELQGEGTAESPYLIQTVEDLQLFASNYSNSSAYFLQTADIDLKNQEWVPIGNTSNPFTGNYNGGNHTISGLKITTNQVNSTGEGAGFFGVVKDATIKNLTIADGDITVTAQEVGAIVGRMTNSKLYNCVNFANVTNLANNHYQMTGGIFGHAVDQSTEVIANCYNAGTVSAPNADAATNRGIGGIGGHISGESQMISCYNTGKVTAGFGTTGSYIGGIIGEHSSVKSSIHNCYWVTDGENGITQGKGVQRESNSGEGTDFQAAGKTLAEMQQADFTILMNSKQAEAAQALGIAVEEVAVWKQGDNGLPSFNETTNPELGQAKQELSNLIKQAENIDLSQCLPEGQEEFQSALAQANVALNDPAATVDSINLAKENLQQAIDNLKPIPSVDKTALETLYNQVKDTDLNQYVDGEAKDTFVAELEKAKNLIANEEATQEQVNEAVTALQNAYDALEKKPVEPVETNKDILNKVIVYAEEQKASDDFNNVIADVQESFNAALDAAKEIAADPAATQDAVDAAWKALMTEIHKLGFVKGDITSLEALVSLAEGYDMNDFVEAGQAEFLEALKAAQDLLADKDNAMQAEIETAETNLLNAMLNLRYKADKSILEKVIAEANDKDASAYTAESYAVLEAAVAEANAVMANENATQEEVDAAVASVQEAMKGLVAVEKPSTETPDDNKADGTQTGQESTTTKANAAKTGDVAPIAGAVALAIAAGTAIVLKKKK